MSFTYENFIPRKSIDSIETTFVSQPSQSEPEIVISNETLSQCSDYYESPEEYEVNVSGKESDIDSNKNVNIIRVDILETEKSNDLVTPTQNNIVTIEKTDPKATKRHLEASCSVDPCCSTPLRSKRREPEEPEKKKKKGEANSGNKVMQAATNVLQQISNTIGNKETEKSKNIVKSHWEVFGNLVAKELLLLEDDQLLCLEVEEQIMKIIFTARKTYLQKRLHE
ncbi:hypothetical protein QE152_g40548 [Popillia japonica]|uniref:Uncharacterized protein n=1 Tax=Popillia japonica TaxID=7064 RepID=A0AAW1HFX2_POPJA